MTLTTRRWSTVVDLVIAATGAEPHWPPSMRGLCGETLGQRGSSSALVIDWRATGSAPAREFVRESPRVPGARICNHCGDFAAKVRD